MSSTYWSILVVIIYYSTVVYSSSCQPLNHQLSQCNNYITSDSSVYYNSNQSSQLAVALNATVKVIGSYCRDRSMELLCNYFFPQCMSDNIVPICSSSCSEYLHTGICFDHIFTLLIDLNNTENYPNVSVDNLLQRDCSPLYNLSISEDCVSLTDVPDASDHVQCVPLLTNGTCSAIENYAIDIAQVELNIAIANALESARSAVLESDIDPSCITRLDWIMCIFRFPPCLDSRLLLICGNACGELLYFFANCYNSIEEHVINQTIRDHLMGFICRSPYYGFNDERYFIYDDDDGCIDIPTELSITSTSPITNDTINTDESSGGSSSNGIIIGTVLGVCATILIVIILLLMMYWKRKLPKKNPHNYMVGNNQIPDSSTTVPDMLFHEFEKAFAGEIINPHDLIIKEQIGKGAFGKVHKGVYTKETEVLDVAIKTLRAIDASKTEQFIKECIIAKRFNHPNILNLIGVSYIKGESPLMILPFMCNGDVKSFVKSKRGNILEVIKYPEGLDYNILAKICLDIVNGMKYLSSLRCVHRDLAARNCMLDENMIAKVADFGLSRDVYITDYYRIGHNTPLPIKWLAPEALIDRVFTTQSDVWSFGVTCWEIFTLGLQPYPSVDEHDMVNYLKSGKILDKPILSSDKMYEIMKSCWKFEPEDRATFCLLVELVKSAASC